MDIVMCLDCYWLGDEKELELFEVPEDEYAEGDSPYAKGCPNCKTDACLVDLNYDCELSQDELKNLWRYFRYININDNDEIEEEFLGFPVGTDRFDIWHWFDERLEGGLGNFLYRKWNSQQH